MLIHEFKKWQKIVCSDFPSSVTCPDCCGLSALYSEKCNTCGGRSFIPIEEIINETLYEQMVRFYKNKFDLWANGQPKHVPKGWGLRYEGFISPMLYYLEAWGLESGELLEFRC